MDWTEEESSTADLVLLAAEEGTLSVLKIYNFALEEYELIVCLVDSERDITLPLARVFREDELPGLREEYDFKSVDGCGDENCEVCGCNQAVGLDGFKEPVVAPLNFFQRLWAALWKRTSS